MSIISSLTNRVFLACTVLAMLSLGVAFSFVNARATTEAEAELRRGLAEAATLVDQHRATLTDTLTRMARVVADLPKLKAVVDIGDPPTAQPLAEEYLQHMKVDLLLLTGRREAILGLAGADASALASAVRGAPPLEEVATFEPHARGVLQVVSVPILIDGILPDILGRLTVGVFLDDRLAAQFKDLTGSEIAFGAQGRILASTLPAASREPLALAIGASGMTSVAIGEEEFLALARPLVAPLGRPEGRPLQVDDARQPDDAGADLQVGPDAPVSLVLRSRTERLRFLTAIRTGLTGVLVVTLVLATILSYGVARTMTRPLAAITTAMRDVAATGDLTRKVTLESRPWDDEDARLLASTFNTLTDSIARFQREAAHKDRLSSLGRLSTVIAHEIRNPLMIIRASLSSLRREGLSATELREAVADIDEETLRLNRIVTEVLDFARPIRFELEEADINDICRSSAEAAWTGDPGSIVALDLDRTTPPIITDAERLRTALVNILTNARHALRGIRRDAPLPADAGGHAGAAGPQTGARGRPPAAVGRVAVRPDEPALAARSADADRVEPGVRVTTTHGDGRVTISVRDRGVGIAPEDMPHIFDPYFTTRRAGTGLGLPIAKNIIEGLGGTIAVSSRRGEGTEIRIELPKQPPVGTEARA